MRRPFTSHPVIVGVVDDGGRDPRQICEAANVDWFKSGELAYSLAGVPIEIANTPAGVFDGGRFPVRCPEQEATTVGFDAPPARRASAAVATTAIVDHMVVKGAEKDQVVQLGRPALEPVDHMVGVEPPGGPAAGELTHAMVAQFECCAYAFGYHPRFPADRERPAVVFGEGQVHPAVTSQPLYNRPTVAPNGAVRASWMSALGRGVGDISNGDGHHHGRLGATLGDDGSEGLGSNCREPSPVVDQLRTREAGLIRSIADDLCHLGIDGGCYELHGIVGQAGHQGRGAIVVGSGGDELFRPG